MSQKTTTPSDTYDFLEILTLGAEALLRADVLIKSKQLPGRTKDWLRISVINRLRAMNNDMTSFLPEGHRRVVEVGVVSPEATLQMRAIRDGVMELAPEDRDKVEAFIDQLKSATS